MSRLKTPIAKRFWRKCWNRGPDACWLWLGAVNDAGYGIFLSDERVVVEAHRVAYKLTHPEEILAKDDFVSHVLDCMEPRICVNPAHLIRSNSKEVAILREKRKRTRIGLGLWDDEIAGRKLNVSDVRDILAKLPTVPVARLALKYDVSETHIRHILQKNRWANVKPLDIRVFL